MKKIIEEKQNNKAEAIKQINNDIKENKSLVILDPKKIYYNNFYQTLKDNNYEITLIDLNNPRKSDNYNPLTYPFTSYQNKEIDKEIELIDNISKELIRQSPMTDPYWYNAASSLLSGLIMILIENAKEEEINLGSVYVSLNKIDVDKMRNYLNKLSPTNPIYSQLSSIYFAPPETRLSIISVLNQELKKYTIKPNLLDLESVTNFNLINFGKTKQAIFISQREDLKENNELANILIDDILDITKNNQTKVSFILDNIMLSKPILKLIDYLNMDNKNQDFLIITNNLNNLPKEILNAMDKIEEFNSKGQIKLNQTNIYPHNKNKTKYFDITKMI